MNKPNTEVSQSQHNGEAEQGVPVGYKQTEVGVIPENWSYHSLKEVALFGGGTTPARVQYDKYFLSGIHHWTKTLDLNNGFIFKTEELVTDVALAETSLKKYKAGSVLIAMYGGFNQIGRTGLLKVDSTINQALVAILPDRKKLNSEYLLFNLNYNVEYWRGVASSSRKDPNITSNDVKEYLLPLPSIQEQTAIANALSDVDALLSELENLIAKKQAIKTATMQQLLTGRTRLPQFAHHPDGSKKGYKQSELGEIPEDWATRTYGEIFSFLTTSTNSRSDLSDNGEYGYIHYGDIHTLWSNFLDLDKRTTPKIEPVLVRSAFIQDGDLVMADASEDYVGIGKSIEIKNIGNKLIVAGLHTYLLRDSHSFFVDGFRGYLHEIPAVKSMIDKLATGMKVYGISKGNLEGIYLLIPSKEEQTAIATILSNMDAEIQALEQRLIKTRQIKQGMMQQLLTGKIRLPVEAYN